MSVNLLLIHRSEYKPVVTLKGGPVRKLPILLWFLSIDYCFTFPVIESTLLHCSAYMVINPIAVERTLDSNGQMHLSLHNFLFDIHAVAEL